MYTCEICGLDKIYTKKGKCVVPTRIRGFNAHPTCFYNYEKNIPDQCFVDYTNKGNYPIVRMLSPTLKRYENFKEYDGSANMEGPTGERRKTFLLIVNNKYYFVISRRAVYILRLNISRYRVEGGCHYGITYSRLIDSILVNGPVNGFTGYCSWGWDYNHFEGSQENNVSIEYIYKNISNIIGDNESILYIFLINEMFVMDVMRTIVDLFNYI
jgi:hypothetical protein